MSPDRDLELNTSSLIFFNGNRSNIKMNEFSLTKTQANEDVIRNNDQKEFFGKSRQNSIRKTLFHQQKLKEIFWGKQKQKLQTIKIEKNKKGLSIEKFLNIPIANPAILLDLPLNSKSSRSKTKLQFTESLQRSRIDLGGLDELLADAYLEIPAFESDSETKRYKLPYVDKIKIENQNQNQIKPIKGGNSKINELIL